MRRAAPLALLLLAALPVPGASTTLDEAEAQARQGFLPRAAEDYRAALATPTLTGDDRAAAHLGLGNTLLRLGERAEARRHLDTAATTPATRAAALTGLGVLEGAEGRADAATTRFRAAFDAAAAAGQPLTAAQAAINAARTLPANARPWLEHAATHLDRAPETPAAVLAWVALGRGWALLPDGRPAARAAYARAAALAERLGDRRGESFAWGYMGQLYEHTGQRVEARDLTGRAIAAAVAADAPDSLYLWHWQAGRLATTEADAAAAFERAVAMLDGVRADLTAAGTPGGEDVFRERVEPVFRGYADRLLRAAAPGDPAPLIRARAVMEQMKAAELEDYFKDDCVAALDSRSRPIDRVAERTAALYPIILPDRLEMLVSIGDGIQRFTVPVDRRTLTHSVDDFRRLLEKRSTHQYMDRARELYGWLIRPLETQLAAAGIDTLVIVPDGPLRTIPLAALHDGTGFLASRYAVTTAPGLTLTDPRPLAPDRAGLLLAGVSEGVQGYAPLPHVGEETERLSRLFPARVLLNEDFTAARLAGELRRTPYSLVHIASHGEVRGDHAQSFLLTHDGRLTLDRLEALVRLGRFRPDPVELLVLSACQTAAGDERAALGLAGVAIKAGARSALASLWSVSDEASARLMEDFYAQLRTPGVTKAESLRRAQAALIANPRYRHPYYWSGFVLIGNWL